MRIGRLDLPKIFLVGIAILTIALTIYPYQEINVGSRTIPCGITFLMKDYIISNKTYFEIIVSRINYHNSSAKVGIIFDMNRESGNDATIILTIPFKISNCVGGIFHLGNFDDPNYFPEVKENLTTKYYDDYKISFILIHLPEKAKNFRYYLTFTWIDCLTRVSFDTYEVNIPIGYSDILLSDLSGMYSGMEPYNFSDFRIVIEDPPDCKPIFYTPPVTRTHFASQTIFNEWYSFSSNEIFYPPPLGAVRIQYQADSLSTEKDIRLYLSGAFLGTSTSVIITEAYKIKWIRKKEINNEPQC
jgi:hypothetical protein